MTEDPSSYHALDHPNNNRRNSNAGYRLYIPVLGVMWLRSWRSCGDHSYPSLSRGGHKPDTLQSIPMMTWMAFARDMNDARISRFGETTRSTITLYLICIAAVILVVCIPNLQPYHPVVSLLLLAAGIALDWIRMNHFRTIAIPALQTVTNEWESRLADQGYRIELVVEEESICCGFSSSPLVHLYFDLLSSPVEVT
jgi:hypothetical protein